MPLLSVENVTKRFGGILALNRVSFEVEEGDIVGLIGPNGAGKTTAFNVITRVYSADEGSVALDGRDLLKTPPHRVIRRGVARTFQNVELFGGMTVLENVLVGAHATSGLLGGRRARRRARRVLRYLDLGHVADRPAASLPFGTRKRVETARALVARPRLLLLDEPAGGLNHDEVTELGRFIGRVRTDFDLTILLVEHHMNLVMGISDRVHVLDFGTLIASGTPEEVQRDPKVVEAYLGVPEDGASRPLDVPPEPDVAAEPDAPHAEEAPPREEPPPADEPLPDEQAPPSEEPPPDDEPPDDDDDDGRAA